LNLKILLEKEFEMSYQGELQYLLGLQIERNIDEGWLKISQPKYLRETLCRYKMESCKPKSTPFVVGLVLTKDDILQTSDDHSSNPNFPYSQAVGSLMHVVINSRLDACYSVSCLAQYLSNSNAQYWQALKHVLHYFQGSLDIGIIYR